MDNDGNIDGKKYEFTKLKLKQQVSMQAQVVRAGMALARGGDFDVEFQYSASKKLFKHMTCDGYEVILKDDDAIDEFFDSDLALFNKVFYAAVKFNFPSIFAKLTALAEDKDSALSQGLKKSGLATRSVYIDDVVPSYDNLTAGVLLIADKYHN